LEGLYGDDPVVVPGVKDQLPCGQRHPEVAVGGLVGEIDLFAGKFLYEVVHHEPLVVDDEDIGLELAERFIQDRLFPPARGKVVFGFDRHPQGMEIPGKMSERGRMGDGVFARNALSLQGVSYGHAGHQAAHAGGAGGVI